MCSILACTFPDTRKVAVGDEGMGLESVQRVARSQGFMIPSVKYSVLGCFQGEMFSNESIDETHGRGGKGR